VLHAFSLSVSALAFFRCWLRSAATIFASGFASGFASRLCFWLCFWLAQHGFAFLLLVALGVLLWLYFLTLRMGFTQRLHHPSLRFVQVPLLALRFITASRLLC
jgi:type II secretory pathway component PulF